MKIYGIYSITLQNIYADICLPFDVINYSVCEICPLTHWQKLPTLSLYSTLYSNSVYRSDRYLNAGTYFVVCVWPL